VAKYKLDLVIDELDNKYINGGSLLADVVPLVEELNVSVDEVHVVKINEENNKEPNNG